MHHEPVDVHLSSREQSCCVVLTFSTRSLLLSIWNEVVLTEYPLIQQIITHMEESGVYNESDLAPFQRRLQELRDIVQHDAESEKHPKALTTLLERQLNECGMNFFELRSGRSLD